MITSMDSPNASTTRSRSTPCRSRSPPARCYGLLGPERRRQDDHPARARHPAARRRRLAPRSPATTSSARARGRAPRDRRRQRRHGALRPPDRPRGARLLRASSTACERATIERRIERLDAPARPARHPRQAHGRVLHRHEAEDRHRARRAARPAGALLRRGHERPRRDGAPRRARLLPRATRARSARSCDSTHVMGEVEELCDRVAASCSAGGWSPTTRSRACWRTPTRPTWSSAFFELARRSGLADGADLQGWRHEAPLRRRIAAKEILSTLRDTRAIVSNLVIPLRAAAGDDARVAAAHGRPLRARDDHRHRAGRRRAPTQLPVELVALAEAQNAVLVDVDDAVAAVRERRLLGRAGRGRRTSRSGSPPARRDVVDRRQERQPPQRAQRRQATRRRRRLRRRRSSPSASPTPASTPSVLRPIAIGSADASTEAERSSRPARVADPVLHRHLDALRRPDDRHRRHRRREGARHPRGAARRRRCGAPRWWSASSSRW